ncbi:MAG TPA: hypothetical protein VF035_07700 [Longimicrobiales bacterium]
MTQESRTTESETRDNAAIREIMHSIRDRLTVPDRATLCLGLVGHLATLMNSRQMEKFMGQLVEEAARVQDVPPARQAGIGAHASNLEEGMTASDRSATRDADDRDERTDNTMRAGAVGQAGRGAITEERTRLL